MKTITAEKILEGAVKAQPFNILKLTDGNEYCSVPYSEFKTAIIGHPKQKQIDELLDQVIIMEEALPEKYDKIYIYFILGLSEILHEA